MKNIWKIIYLSSLGCLVLVVILLIVKFITFRQTGDIKINLTYLTYKGNTKLKEYTKDMYDEFVSDYKANKLPAVYVTDFLYDGVNMYKPYDLDDFITDGNDIKVTELDIKTININTTGDILFSGELTGGMIAVNTNNVKGNINLLLNNAKIDTDSKKIPAVYVYNKDVTYTSATVTIKALKGTNNYLEGGKLKKISLIGSDKLADYTDKYSEGNKDNYTKYTNYYGIYTSADINKILFAKVTADNEDLQDGDPYYFYKAAGAVSSDIDLYFEGEGYLEVNSKNNEGIESKGNLTFSGGKGSYLVNAYDDCINTTTKSQVTNARNTITIDVGKLYAMVSLEADEGDAIDSNGKLIINNGEILALAKPGADAGIDSESGIYLNGGTVIATGDMYDDIKSDSSQKFMTLSFSDHPVENDVIVLLDESEEVVFAYKTDRTYTSLIYSSQDLEESTYTLYKGGEVTGGEKQGIYYIITAYTKGTILGYSSNGGRGPGNMTPPNGDMEPPEKKDGMPPENREGDMTPPDGEAPKEIPNGNNTTASNKEFKISGIANLFSGIANYS